MSEGLKEVNGWMVPTNDKMITKKIGQGVPPESKETDTVGYERHFRKYLTRHVTKKEVMLDVGGNIGIWAKPMSDHFKKVITFEPAPRNLEALKMNIAGISNIELIEKAVGENHIESAEFHDTFKNCGGIKIAELSGREESKENDFTAEVITIDSLELDECDLIKIDVEGYEFPVLKGAVETIKRCKPWIITEKNEEFEMLDAWISDLGFYTKLDSKLCAIYSPETNVDQNIYNPRVYHNEIKSIRSSFALANLQTD